MATKKDIRALCSAIRKGELMAADELILAQPALINAVASSPPKMDDGLSPLQVACKSENLHFALRLIEKGADVSFVDASEVPDHGSPVLHDVVRSASLYAGKDQQFHPGKFDENFNVVKVMLERGAHPEAKDLRGNSTLYVAFQKYAKTAGRNKTRLEHFKFGPLIPSFRLLVDTLLAAGANPDTICAGNRSTRDLAVDDGLGFLLPAKA